MSRTTAAVFLVLAFLAVVHGQAQDWVFRSLLTQPPSSLGDGGNVRPAFSPQWPNLAGAGVGAVVLQLEPNATHLPHWHRGTELLFVINGNLTVGLVDFNGTTFEYNVTNGDLVAVPTAAAHYVHNRGPGRSINLSAFSNENPGTQLSATTLFAFNDAIVQQAIQVTDVESLRSVVVKTPALLDGDAGTNNTVTTGNFTQALYATTASYADAQLPASAVSAAGR